MESEYRKGYVYIQKIFAGTIAETEEGWLLGVVSRNWKINQNDRFGLLLSVCRDCIGDVNIRNGEEK